MDGRALPMEFAVVWEERSSHDLESVRWSNQGTAPSSRLVGRLQF